jgi:hypothetical protein
MTDQSARLWLVSQPIGWAPSLIRTPSISPDELGRYTVVNSTPMIGRARSWGKKNTTR